MDALKFCSATAFQIVLFILLISLSANLKYRFSRGVRRSLGVQSRSRVSPAAGGVVTFSVIAFLSLVFEVSTLVLGAGTIRLLVIAFLISVLAGLSLSARLREILRPLLFEQENARFAAFSIVLGLSLLSVSIGIEASFRLKVQSVPIEATVLTVRPARLGSPVNSVKVAIPAVELNGKTQGISYFRYHTRQTTDSIIPSQKLNLVLQRGGLGLNRAVPFPENQYLKGNLIGY